MSSILQRNTGIPLKYQIRDSLLKELDTLKYGEKIPSEESLAGQYGVSRGTIRQVVLDLTNQGMLFRIQGKGTFKSGIVVFNSGFNITSLTEHLIKGGLTPGIKNIRITSEVPDEKICTLLMIDSKEIIWKISRIRLANGIPISKSTAYFRKELAPDLVETDLEMSFINMITRKFGVSVIKSINNCTAVLSDKVLSRQLEIDVGSPILYVEHIAYGYDGRPSFVDISETIGDRYIQRFEQIGIS
jgi:GntR family transcriptional regulator